MPGRPETYQDETLQRRLPSIYHCIFCGDELGKVSRRFCAQCGTKAGRDQVRAENREVGIVSEIVRGKVTWKYVGVGQV